MSDVCACGHDVTDHGLRAVGCFHCGNCSEFAERSTYVPLAERAEAPDAVIVQAIIGLPARLRAHRAARGLSMREVARDVGISFSTVHRVEHGQDYTVDNLIRLAAYLDGQP